jgi:uncharacterized phage protein gp47/JayE
MGITLPTIDYTSRDYNSFKNDMITLVTTKVPEWTNVTESDFGVILIELFAHVADSLAYYQDKQANEAFLATAQLRKNVISLCKLIDYSLAGPVASTGQVTFTVPVSGLDQTVPTGTVVGTPGSTTEDPIYFELLADVTIPAGLTTGIGNVVEGRTYTDNLGNSDASPNQSFALPRTPAITPTIATTTAITVEVDQGLGYETWAWVDNIIESAASDKVWYFQTDENDVTYIQFGDGFNGAIPTNGAAIRATYRVGGGLRGNVGVGTITKVISGPVFVSSVTNANVTSGGDDKESLDHARVFAPASLKRNNRVVTLDDYKSIAGGYPGVVKAGAIDTVTPLNLCTVNVYIEPTGGGTASPTLLADIEAYIDKFRPVCTQVVMHSANYIYVNISATINVLAGYSQVSCESNVNLALINYFAPGQFEFGKAAYISDIYALLEATDGVDYLSITQMTMQPDLQTVRATGDATFGSITTSANITAEVWTILFTDATHFTVTGSSSGLQTATGTLGTVYNNDVNSLHFQITAGVVPMVAGDSFTITTLTNLQNVPTTDMQVLLLGTVTLTMVGGA